MGASGWGGARRVGVLPIALALGLAGLVGFGIARWAARPVAKEPAVASEPRPAPARSAPPSTFAPPDAASLPPATAPAPTIPSAAATSAPPARTDPSRAAASSAPGTAQPRTATDPRAPVPVPPALVPETNYALQAVTEQDGQPVAIVNGQLVRVGDVLEGARILRIEPEAVEIEKNGRRIVLSF